MRLINGRILFIIFIVMFGSLLILQQTSEILTASRFGDTYVKENFSEPICGEIYKAAWNRDCDFILNCDNYKILVRGTYLNDEVIRKIKAAEYIVLKTEPEVPKMSGNFGEFDMQKYLAAKNIDYVSYPNNGDIEVCDSSVLSDKKHSVQYYSSKIRTYIENALKKSSDENTASVCMSIMTGDSALLESDSKTSFQKAGLSHLMAVSGAHVAFIVNPVKQIISKIKSRKFGIKYKNLILVPFVILITFISGFTPSIVRAVLMYICLILSVIFCRRYDPLNSLGFAGIILLLINPCYVFDTGFILSFGACICLYTVLPALKNIKAFSDLPFKRITDGLLSGIAVGLGITPIIINMFNGFSLISIVVNLIASPLSEIVCTGSYILTFAASVCLPDMICRLISYPMTSVVFLLEKCADFADGGLLGYRTYASFPTVYFIIYYLLLFFAVIYLGKRKKISLYKGLITTGAITTVLIIFSIPPEAEFLFFDVGQGVSVLFKTRDGYCGLIDSGDGRTDISSLLRKESVSDLDFIIISHGHADHGGGFEDIIENYDCDAVLFPDNSYDVNVIDYALMAESKDITVKYIEDELVLNIGKYTTLRLICYTENSNINNSSVIAVFEGEWGRVVLPGDIESKSEIKFAEEYEKQVDLICVSHHGSDTSSSDEFLKTLNPKYAIISVGEDNQYGHPSRDVIDRIDDFTLNSNIYRTDFCGAVRFRFGTVFNFFGEDVKIWQKKKSSE
ncbi:MAG: DNA internalization-related competence protein ComEC/Rec2 [Clostridia bacterium]|nr:DNA internalization-related competence protein ComEC/Rec2 [Clostridia bacterium]